MFIEYTSLYADSVDLAVKIFLFLLSNRAIRWPNKIRILISFTLNSYLLMSLGIFISSYNKSKKKNISFHIFYIHIYAWNIFRRESAMNSIKIHFPHLFCVQYVAASVPCSVSLHLILKRVYLWNYVWSDRGRGERGCYFSSKSWSQNINISFFIVNVRTFWLLVLEIDTSTTTMDDENGEFHF